MTEANNEECILKTLNTGHPVVLITGAASGIGRELAYLYAERGAKVGLIDIDRHALEAYRSALPNTDNICFATADVGDRKQIREAVSQVMTSFGHIDIAISCAGICRASTVDDLNIPDAEDMFRVNFLGTLYLIDAMLPFMLARNSGHIVGISSLAGIRGIPFEPAYSATKAAVGAYLESLRVDLRKRGIAVTTVFPGYVQTPLLDAINGTLGADMSNGKAWSAKAAAVRIAKAVDKRKSYISFPRMLGLGVHLSRLLPPFIYDRIMEQHFQRFSKPSGNECLEPESS